MKENTKKETLSNLVVEHLKPSDLAPYKNNAKKHDAAQISKLCGSIKEFGFNNPVLIDKDNGIIAGHGRVMAAQSLALESVPCIRLGHLTDTQRRAYILADNRLAEIGGGWDEEMLKLELADLAALEVDVTELGFGPEDLAALDMEEEKSNPDADAEPQIDKAEELRAKWGVEPGQLWELGAHRILCGDSTIPEHVAKLMEKEKAKLIHADPPYGMGKEKDGVENDNLYRENLDAFQMEWWRAIRPHTENNGSAYIWGNAEDLWRLWYVGGLAKSERFTFRNEIVWKKNTAQGMESSTHRMFPNGTERCLFFMIGEQGFNNNAENYWEGWEPIRAYLVSEKEKSGLTNADILKITSTYHTHYWATSQWCFPTESDYKAIQKAAKGKAFKREHDELKLEHDELKREFYATRAHFDNTHETMADVWEFASVTGEERHGHATPKPVPMICRAIKSSTPAGGLVYEPFSGSGTTLIACEQLGRKCRTIEISPAYVAVAIQRWADATGKEPKRL
jgi:DNA modification methylase